LLAISLYTHPESHDLHPFPTRRSSDLGDVVIVPTTSTSFISGTGLKKCKPMNRSTRFVAVIISVMIREDVLLAKMASDFTILSRDRKSTRLNSSHRTISYAVFCLKKKK